MASLLATMPDMHGEKVPNLHCAGLHDISVLLPCHHVGCDHSHVTEAQCHGIQFIEGQVSLLKRSIHMNVTALIWPHKTKFNISA